MIRSSVFSGSQTSWPQMEIDIGDPLWEKVQSANSIFQLQRQLFARSERVKGIDFHPLEPWILTTLYSGMPAMSLGLL